MDNGSVLEGEAPSFGSVADRGAAGANVRSNITPVAKLYRYCPENEFKDTLIVRTMVELIESRRIDTCSLNGLIIEYYHSNLRNTKVNPRPESWSERPNEYLKHAFWSSQQEWDEYEEQARLRGKPSATNPEAGIPADLQAQARTKFARWLFLKADILNNTHLEWVKLFPNGKMASGASELAEYAEKLRLILFKKWCFEPTSKGSKIIYKSQQMPQHFIPFTTWKLWVRIGPSAGKFCRAVFNNECCNPAAPPDTKNGADTSQLPKNVESLVTMSQAGKAQFYSRRDMRKFESPKAGPAVATVPAGISKSAIKDQIKHLKYLVSCPHTSESDKTKYGERLFKLHTMMLEDFEDGLSSRTHISVSGDTETTDISSSEKIMPADEAGPHSLTLISNAQARSDSFFVEFQRKDSPVAPSPKRLFQPEDTSYKASSTSSCKSLQYQTGVLNEYLDWLTEYKILYIVPTNADGRCLFQSALHGIKELVYNNSDYKVWGPTPDWKTFSASMLRSHVLKLMEDCLEMPFTVLGSENFEDLIMKEGKEIGIVRSAWSDCSNPPEMFRDCSTFFDAMQNERTYGMLSCVLAIAIFFKVQVHVWAIGFAEPTIHNPTAKHTINLFKKDKSAHYDSLSHSTDLSFLAPSQSILVQH
jgi:hypothetical protein